MLQAPAFSQINGVTIYSDDAYFYKFYPIAAAPSARTDANGRPVFLLVKYAFSDDDRLADPSLPPGGGYLNFDVQFSVPEAELAAIAAKLQPMVDAKWREYKAGTADDQARAGVAGTTAPPKVEFGTPTYTAGAVAMDAPQAKELIAARVGEATPSLLTNNVAVFSMDLTGAGATFMQRTLVQPNGAAIDLTPIQVGYDLKFWARLPPVRIHVTADSKKVYDSVRKVMDGRGVDGCTTYDFQHTDISDDTMTASGAIDVQIDTGSGSVPDAVIEELRKYSLDLVKQMIQVNFFTSTPPGAANTPPPPVGGGNSKKYLKTTHNAAEMKIDVNLEQRSVVEWPIHPQATLETFFKGMTAAEIKQHVRDVDLDDDFFKNLTLNIRVFTDFTDPAISNVEVQVRYTGTDENGVAQEKNKTATFTSLEPQKWSVSLIGSERRYQYRYRVGFKGQEAGAFTDWTVSTSPDLNVSVPSPGKLDVTVLAGDIDFETLVQQVQVRVAYQDPDNGVARQEDTLVLTAASQESHYQRTIFKPQRQPVQYRNRFRMKSGEIREDATWATASGPQLLINQPFTDVLRVSLLPAGDGWDDIVSVSVEMKYEDPGNNYTVQESIALRSKEEFKTWKVYLRDRNVRSFRYETVASYKNGHLERTGPIAGEGTGTYPIVVKRRGYRIALLPDLLDFASSPVTEVHLIYRAAGLNLQETFKFTDKTPQTWSIDVPPGAPLDYTVQVTHFPANGSPVHLKEVIEHDSIVVLPGYRLPNSGKIAVQVFSTLVNFTATPLVTVDLHYDDELNNVHLAGALTFSGSQTQTWEIGVKDVNQKQFRYTLSYFAADGTAHTVAPVTQDTPRIVIPRFNA